VTSYPSHQLALSFFGIGIVNFYSEFLFNGKKKFDSIETHDVT